MGDIALVLLTDAAWAVREDGSSQGGYDILLCHKRVMSNETSDCVRAIYWARRRACRWRVSVFCVCPESLGFLGHFVPFLVPESPKHRSNMSQ